LLVVFKIAADSVLVDSVLVDSVLVDSVLVDSVLVDSVVEDAGTADPKSVCIAAWVSASTSRKIASTSTMPLAVVGGDAAA
jgi:hypothetical protein